MKVVSKSFGDGQRMPVRIAFGKHDRVNHFALSDNLSPHLGFEAVPEAARSLVVVCHDPDVPSRGDDVNQEGRTVPATLPRVDFTHWLLVDLDPTVGELAEGAFSEGVTPKGKPGPGGPQGTRQGLNGYTQWFEGDPDMGGRYFGYDGPAPPWNDELLHHYHFTVYALDVVRAPVEGAFDRATLLAAIEEHVLASAVIVGTYAINPDVSG